MKKYIIIAALGLITGCDSLSMPMSGKVNKNSPQAKAEAFQRWSHARAALLCRVANECYCSGQLDEAANRIREAVAMEPNNVDAHTLMGKVLIEQGEYDKAAAELATACRLDPNAVQPVYLTGVAREKLGEMDEALASYRRAESMDGSSLDSVMAATEVLVAMGELRQAQHEIESCMPKAGNEPGMYELAGRVTMMNQEPVKSARYFQQACDLKPNNVRYRESLAAARFAAGMYPEAVQTLTALSQVKEYTLPVWGNKMLGDSYLAMNRPQDARIAYQVAADANPDQPAGWVLVAKASLYAQDYRRAIQAARQAAQIAPDDIDAVMMLGYSLLRDGQSARAVEELKGVASANPRNATLWCLLGRCHAAAGNAPEARKCYAAALKAEPGNLLARDLEGTAAKEISKLN